MRTTIDLRNDLLQAAREQAARENVTIGELISRWAERGRYAPEPISANVSAPTRKGFRVVLPRRDEVISVAHVQKLIDEEGV
jgi:predicted DNA-binding ribbon-helix-helix protein